jgi:threonine dehydrogenase-like Zn-dependent dehydrogenase
MGKNIVKRKRQWLTYSYRLGADTVFDTACSQASLDIGTDVLRKGGCYYSFGFYHEAVCIPSS